MLPQKKNISAALQNLKHILPSKNEVLSEPPMLLSKEDFRKHLALERLRSDQSNFYFTLIISTVSKSSLQNEQKKKLYYFLNNEFMVTDIIGWIDEQSPGIILYAADREEAFTFLRHLKERGNVPEIASSQTAIFTYPYEKEKINSQFKDDRKSDRIEIQLKAKITLLTQQKGEDKQLQGIVSKDISESGVYLETSAPLQLGQEVNLTTSLPLTCTLDNTENQVQIKAVGKIVQKQDQGMAIAFDSCELLPRTEDYRLPSNILQNFKKLTL